MVVHRWFVQNTLRNFQHIIFCENTLHACILDPYDTATALTFIQAQNLTLKYILNTHDHHDHIAGNSVMQKSTGATIAASLQSREKIPEIGLILEDGTQITIGNSITLTARNLPGHTNSHMGYFTKDLFFTGDSLFNAGCGHCRLGGNVQDHFRTFTDIISKIPDHIKIYPGHDYLKNNLNFSLHVEPDNAKSVALLPLANVEEYSQSYISTMGQERGYNPFLRLDSRSLRKTLSELTNTDLLTAPDELVFTSLRELRNHW